nr:RNA-directed DNA polymerase, eukaryota [Tanacetum cinerariifolium]
MRLNIIAVYAPYELKDKQMLWDYLTYEIGKWKREVREGPCDESNAMINMMIKLKYLKTKIREWNKKNMLSAKNVKAKYKDELEALEAIIDKGDGDGNLEVVNKRMKVVNTLQKIDKICSSEMAQKAKGEFFHHFSSRFDKPDARWAHIEMKYPKTLTCDQQVELECDVSSEEIKRAVWDCGIDKSPGPDGFTFDKKETILIFKVDFEKAYDSVRWNFLDDILKNFRFGEKLCKWIQSCLRSSRGSIIINGSPTKEFQFFKGLKQGDPLSSFLFILIMESLYLSFQRVVDAGIFKGIKLSSLLSISHMFYAKDAVFAGQWCDGNITTLVHVLECFYRASGLRINMSKSKIMGVLVDSDKVKCDASKLGCLILKPSFSYLEKGGLGVSSLYALNRGLMFKWRWRFYMQNTSLWVRVINAIHGDDGKVGGYVKDGAKSCWLSIVNEINSLKDKGKALKNRYPRIYSLETCKLITVGMKLAYTSLDSSFRRALESSEDFSVASVRKVIDDKSLSEVDSNTQWIKYVPIKVNVHAWKVKTDSLPTRFNISRRVIHIDSIMCAICDKGAETSSHLFFPCCMARQTVRMITRWWDVPYGEVDSYEDWINWFVNLRLSYKHKQMLEGVFYVKWWLLWKFRNKLMFDSIPPSQAFF